MYYKRCIAPGTSRCQIIIRSGSARLGTSRMETKPGNTALRPQTADHHSHLSSSVFRRPPREPRQDPVFLDLPRPLPAEPRRPPREAGFDLYFLGWYSSSVHRGQSLKPEPASDFLDRYSCGSGFASVQLEDPSRNRALSLGRYPSSVHRFPFREPAPSPDSLRRYSSASVQLTLSSLNPGRALFFLGRYSSPSAHSLGPSL